MKIRNPKSEIGRLIYLVVKLGAVTTLHAAAKVEPEGETAKLLPAYGELPPTFWEQHGMALLIATLVVVAFAAFVIWLSLRPKPAVIVPPEVEARRALSDLLNRSEDGNVLTRVSQILRRYVIAAFELPSGEPTTAEVCRTMVSHDQIGSELSSAVSRFLRECDEYKFSPQSPPKPMDATNRALELIALAEARRAELRRGCAVQDVTVNSEVT